MKSVRDKKQYRGKIGTGSTTRFIIKGKKQDPEVGARVEIKVYPFDGQWLRCKVSQKVVIDDNWYYYLEMF